MLLRTGALTLSALLFTAGIARADLYINVVTMKVAWQSGGCAFARSAGAVEVYRCNGSGLLTLKDYAGRYSGSCTVDWSGRKGGHWDFYFKTNNFGADKVHCVGHWANSNTLDVKLDTL